ncbi:cell wall hydrolase [Vibrio phage 1.063.O._10N.261.45.C7]|nr:cell wall hydrolase [Vibrio phage 1.063.O._10N.261.45.C7]
MRKRDYFRLCFILTGLCYILWIDEVRSQELPTVPPYSDMQGKPLSTIECLAVNSYHESRGESDAANLAVMSTVYARSLLGGRYGDDMCEVIFKPNAYSWTSDGKSDKIYNVDQYMRLYSLAEKFLVSKDLYLEVFERSDHYHVVGHKTGWNYRKLDYIGRIDNHVFYRHK